jgi:hypothetical protein
MQALNGLLAVVLLLAALAPVLITGGPLIVAFMTRTHILQHLYACLLTLVALVGGALLALQITQMGHRLISALVLAALPWAALWIAKKFILKEEPPQP